MSGIATWSRVLGVILVVIGVIGFLTVADDLRHVGELFGVGVIVFIGLMGLVAASLKSVWHRRAIFWLAGTAGIGAVVGAATDSMVLSVSGGIALGVAGALVISRAGDRTPA
jgi:hypothetical protein